MRVSSARSAEKLTEFLAAVSSFSTEAEAAADAVERAAEALDAEVVAIIAQGVVVAVVGYPQAAVPVAELAAVARGHRGEVTVPGAGGRPAAVVHLEHPRDASLVVARSGPGRLNADELGLLQGMARLTSMTLRTLRLLDDERRLRVESRRKSAENTRLLGTLTAHQELLERLTDEQAALRRVATLVARQPRAEQVLASVAEEVGRLLRAGCTQMLCYEGDGTATVVAAWTDPDVPDGEVSIGARSAVEADELTGFVLRERRATRMGSGSLAGGGPVADGVRRCGLRSATASPIEVEGRLWGAMVAGWSSPEPPVDAESRIVEFAQLVATSISNAHARAEVVRLAEVQAALRRVATLVAKGEKPAAIFTSVAEEIARTSEVDNGFVVRFEPNGSATVVATSGPADVPMGSTWPLGGDGIAARVFRTGRPARVDSYREVAGADTHVVGSGDVAGAGAPIVIGNRLWGVAAATRQAGHPAGLPVDAEERIADFADLLAIAVSNADARTQLTASRARVVAAADEARRRLERNLHDGIQQGLVSLALAVREAEEMVPPEAPALSTVLTGIADGLNAALDELREISRGLHPAILSDGGLEYALKALARRSPVPVTLGVRIEGRLPECIDVPAYYIVSEALANVAKHARASVVHLDVEATGGVVRISVQDDGVGGADPRQGSGLIGLVDRVEVAGGEITITSPPGEGTLLSATLPLGWR